ncbi:hypothetical protein LTQ56_05540 [Mycobacterium intracellulare subsp. intracellulare]|uniref:hypothetical protein n=1 Tax=Mycobacterium intracellulare TaxID=1767 RepID=UPI0019256A4C|nr:hypothetical protein [Mycobacterium intracellulare]UGU08136.1 hypothetical protein LTQ56_05540 [Mycobacterium intracellulare subsp. intracellulare]BCO57155.1 hypothetical protein MINTM005_23990 [Mycobacterium intracellulare]BCO94259.1 hypothetical protein MINTM016_22350 [Mycobacterium intracellulare]
MPSPNPVNIDRPAVPAVADLHLTEDRYVVHDVAALRLPHATGTVRRHVGPDCDVMFTGHVDVAAPSDWIDDTTTAGDAAEAWAFVVRELDAARAEHHRAIAAAIQRHPAGSAIGGAQ